MKEFMSKNSPQGITTTDIIDGQTSGLFNANTVKYRWAYALWELMLKNTWFPQEVDLSAEASGYRQLAEEEKRMYDLALSQVIFMDSLQTNNIVDNVNPWITAPEVNNCLVRQAFEEALHSNSYSVMVESASMNTNEIYEMWRTNDKLYKKNKFIMDTYNKYAEDAPHDFSAKLSMVTANLCLEGIYFYSAFAAFYSLARKGVMVGSSQMIKFIQRDEITHLSLFTNLYNELVKSRPQFYTPELKEHVRQLFREAVELEIEWGRYITQDRILGLNSEVIEKFVKFLANERVHALHMDPLYPEVKENPIPWFFTFSKINETKTNFFEGNNTAYAKGALDLEDF